MKFISKSLLGLVSPLIIASSVQGAVIASSGFSTTVASTSSFDPTDNNASPLIDTRDLSGTGGLVTSAASSLNLDNSTPDTFSVTASSLSSTTSRTGASSPSVSSSLSRFEISFELLSGETGSLSLNFSTVLGSLGVNSSINWSLAGPDPQVAAFTGTANSTPNVARQNGVVSVTAPLTTAGNYTFVVTTLQPSASLTAEESGIAQISNFSLTYAPDSTSVPEPTAALLVALSALGIFRRRRPA